MFKKKINFPVLSVLGCIIDVSQLQHKVDACEKWRMYTGQAQ